MKFKFTLLAMLLFATSAGLLAQNSYLTISELMTEYYNLNLTSGTTASGTYTVRGYVTLWQNGYPQYQNASFYIDDSENGSTTLLQCFRLTGATTADQRKLEVGDYVEIQNTQLANYYGNAELKNGSFTIISAATPAEYKGETTIANFLAQADLKNIYQLTGVVSGLTEGASMTYGNLTLTDETGSVYVYGVLDANGQSGNFASLNVENGDTLTIHGVYSLYNSQIEIKDAQYISHHKFVEEPITPLVCQCGDDVYYTVDFDKETLTVYGSGDMWDKSEPITQYACSITSPLQHIIVEEGVTSIGSFAFDRYHAYSFDRLQSVTLPSSLLRIGKFAFSGCSNLQSISLPSTLQSIGAVAFDGCNISSIYIPENVLYIGGDAFYDCPLMEINVSEQNAVYSSQDGVLFDKAKKTLYLYPRNKAGNIYTIPYSVERIYHEAFYRNDNIISVAMGNHVRQIGISAFEDCDKLISLTLSDSLTAIGDDCVYETALYNDDREWDEGSLYINRNLIAIGRYCPNAPCPTNENGEIDCPDVSDCNELLVDSIYSIKEGTRLVATVALAGDWIKKLTIPSSIEYINPFAFTEGTSIEEIVWNAKHCHDFVIEMPIDDRNEGKYKDTTIVYNPFHDDGDDEQALPIKKISFAKDVEYLPAGLCSVMPNLEEVYNYNPEPIAISEDMFAGVGYTCILYVPKGSKAKYEAAPVWRDFYRIREMEGTEDGIEIIESTNATTTPQKLLLNGNLYILTPDGTIFNAQGAEVK